MTQVVPFPTVGDVIPDPRGRDRALRVSWHHAEGFVVLSIWREDHCVSSARVAIEDVPVLVQSLVDPLAQPRNLSPRQASTS
jgi:hypothetical protein